MRASVACAGSCLVGLALVVAGVRAEASPRPEGEVLSVVPGHALDVMVAPGSDNGDRVADWVVANADSLNVKYVIWKQRIWAPYRPSWRGMGDRGSVTQNHYDHVHISFKAGSGICPPK